VTVSFLIKETAMKASTPYPKRWWALLVVSVSLLVVSLDNTILNVALPSIERDLGASADELQWIVDAYTLVFAGLLLTAGSLGDRFGRRKALQLGLVIFGAGSLLSGVAGSAGELIASRALMGVGAAFIMPSTLSILTNVFPEKERGKAIGIWAAVAGIGVVVGPVAGGWLLEHFEWGAVFFVNLPVVAIAIAAGILFVPESRDPAQARLDPVGAGLSIAGLGLLVWGIIEAPLRGWADPVVLSAVAGGIAVLAAFTLWELRTATPMLDMRHFRDGRFGGGSGAIALAFFALFGSIFFLTQYYQGVLDYGALEAGLRMTPIAIGLIPGGPLAIKLAERFGTARVVALGLTTVAGALGLLSTAQVDSGYGLIAAALIMLGFGMGSTMAPATEAIMSSLPKEKAGVGSATNDTTRMVGGTFGVAVLGSLLSSGYGAGMEAATQGLPGPAASAASDSLGGAAAVAQQLGGEAGRALSQAADSAFVSAMSTSLLVAAGVAFAGAALALWQLPGRKAAAAARGAGA
jgi:EmrB/QacA subfamily drug resistance transporter